MGPLLNIIVSLVPGIIILLTSIGKQDKLRRVIKYEISTYLLIIEATFLVYTCIAYDMHVSPLITAFMVLILAICTVACALLNSRTSLFFVLPVTALVLFIFASGSAIGLPLLIYNVYLLALCTMELFLGKAHTKFAESESSQLSRVAAQTPKSTKTANVMYTKTESESTSSPIVQQSTPVHTTDSTVFIRCLSGTFAGAEFELNCGEVLTIGSDPECCQIVLPGQTIAAAHCKLWFDSSSMLWCVIDLSKDTIYCDDNRTSDSTTIQTLPSGAVLAIGKEQELNRFRLI